MPSMMLLANIWNYMKTHKKGFVTFFSIWPFKKQMPKNVLSPCLTAQGGYSGFQVTVMIKGFFWV